MSINTALLSGVSGLKANSSALASVSDNIQNANTVGYKRVRNDFTAMLIEQSHVSSYNAGGVRATQSAEIADQGSIQASSTSTHLAVSGDGMFVTRLKSDDATASDQYYFTRAGQFSPDEDGFLQNTAGYYLYGWPADESGAPDTVGSTNLGSLEPVQVTGIDGIAEATSNMSISANLDASEAVSTAATTYDLATNPGVSMASGAVTPDFQTTVQIYDSLGGTRTVAMSFLKSPTANEWFAEIHAVPASAMQATGLPDGLLASGTVAFTSDGQLDMANTTLPTSLSIGASDTPVTAPAVGWAASEGLSAQTINFDFAGANTTGGITQYESASELSKSSVDGVAFGVLAQIEVDDDGNVNALFTNGLSRPIYKLPLASFANPSGLITEAGGAYSASIDAGSVILAAANQNGSGLINSYSLEGSTVDLAEEFTNLIVVQRAYSASSKIITTADEMLNELIQLKR
ncbi:flagellar hook-basal body complex protein [Ponticaulis profundi]|uniref:Flagellar hook protein FlgE n=1 Tax=Ponticaulis profundi TaxID=2665222 RepID=A0ABW1S9C0_9PROT